MSQNLREHLFQKLASLRGWLDNSDASYVGNNRVFIVWNSSLRVGLSNKSVSRDDGCRSGWALGNNANELKTPCTQVEVSILIEAVSHAEHWPPAIAAIEIRIYEEWLS